MKTLLAIIACGLLVSGAASCSAAGPAGPALTVQPPVGPGGYVQAPPGGPSWCCKCTPGAELHQYGPGGSIKDMDLSHFDPVAQAKIRAME